MSGIIAKLFGTKKGGGGGSTPLAAPKSPQDQGREWKHAINAEQRLMDRQLRKIQQAQAKAKIEAKKAAKVGEMGAVRIFAKEIIHSTKTIKRMQVTKTQLNSVKMQIDLQVAQIKVSGSLQKSSEVMATMNDLCRVGDIAQTMQGMSREMMKAGLIEEMLDDAMGDVLDDVEEEEADEEVEKVVAELMAAKMEGTKVNSSKMPVAEVVEEPLVEDEEDDDELMAKFNAMKTA